MLVSTHVKKVFSTFFSLISTAGSKVGLRGRTVAGVFPSEGWSSVYGGAASPGRAEGGMISIKSCSLNVRISGGYHTISP